MHSPSPRNTLLLLWGIAVVVLMGGFLLARQEREVRIERDREALREFAAEAQARIQGLEDLYQDHLLRIGRDVTPDEMAIRQAGGEITGLLRISLLFHSGAGIPPLHTMVDAAPDGPLPLPLPAFSAGPSAGASAGPLALLDQNRLLTRDSGWIDEPGKPLMFSVKRSYAEVAVITVSRPLVARAMATSLRAWAEKSFAPIRATGGPDQLLANGEILAGVGIPSSDQPDHILPLRSRFGSFDLASWDVRKTEVRYHPATLAISATLATIIAVLGMVVFLTQRRDEAIARRRVSFVNRVSHELRSPLTNILLNIDLAAELGDADPDESKRRIDLVRTEARRLGRLIENVLTFSRTEEGKMEIQAVPCVPAEIVSTVIDSFLAGFESRGLTIERSDENTGTCFLCDPDALAQILGNLLSNVEKYVPGGVVGIHTRLADEELTIRVNDHGPGIPGEAAERIFQPFERVHASVNEGTSGTGLGLAIARDLAHRLGGELTLLPAGPSGGACFEIRIPAPHTSS